MIILIRMLSSTMVPASFAVDKQGDWQGGIAEAGYRLSPSMTPRLPRDTRIWVGNNYWKRCTSSINVSEDTWVPQRFGTWLAGFHDYGPCYRCCTSLSASPAGNGSTVKLRNGATAGTRTRPVKTTTVRSTSTRQPRPGLPADQAKYCTAL